MKICVYFKPRIQRDNFEGTRLRKSLKGALEANSISYTSALIDDYEIIHFLSLNDEAKINDAIERGKKVIFNALYCEGDISTRCTYIENDKCHLLTKAKHILNKVHVVMAPNDDAKDFLIKEGITTKIVAIPPSVSIYRFENKTKNTAGDELFFNYFQIDRSIKYIATIGDYSSLATVEFLSKIASLCPKYLFLFFGQMKRNEPASYLYNLRKKIPSNLKLAPIMSDEIYSSLLRNASLYFTFDNLKFCILSLFDASICKTQIVSIEPLSHNKIQLKELGAIVANDENDLSVKIDDFMNGKLPSNIPLAYNYVCNRSLLQFGSELKSLYETMLKPQEEKEND